MRILRGIPLCIIYALLPKVSGTSTTWPPFTEEKKRRTEASSPACLGGTSPFLGRNPNPSPSLPASAIPSGLPLQPKEDPFWGAYDLDESLGKHESVLAGGLDKGADYNEENVDEPWDLADASQMSFTKGNNDYEADAGEVDERVKGEQETRYTHGNQYNEKGEEHKEAEKHEFNGFTLGDPSQLEDKSSSDTDSGVVPERRSTLRQHVVPLPVPSQSHDLYTRPPPPPRPPTSKRLGPQREVRNLFFAAPPRHGDREYWRSSSANPYTYFSLYTTHPELGRCHISDFRFLDVNAIASGGFSSVYRAQHKPTRRTFTLKYIDAETLGTAAMSIMREEAYMRMLASQPGIVHYYCSMAGQGGSGVYMVMELVEGHDLSRLLRLKMKGKKEEREVKEEYEEGEVEQEEERDEKEKEKEREEEASNKRNTGAFMDYELQTKASSGMPGEGDFLKTRVAFQFFSYEQVISIARQLVEILEHVHAQCLVHRDLKPANVMVTEGMDGQLSVKLIDFGLAWEACGEEIREAKGTPEYMAPALHLGQAYGASADYFGMAMVIYYITMGGRPYTLDRNLTQEEIKAKFVSGEYSIPPTGHEVIDELIDTLKGAKRGTQFTNLLIYQHA